MRIGIDVGGTNSDAVLMDGDRLVGKVKTPTTPDVTDGVTRALAQLLGQTGVPKHAVQAVMIGTTHFTNAVVERRGLELVAAVRLGLPATRALPPMVGWPDDLRAAVEGRTHLLHGGHEFDGSMIAPLDEAEVLELVSSLRRDGLRNLAITSVFSPITAEAESWLAGRLGGEVPDLTLTLSHEIGRIGLLERENAAILNAALRPLARRIVGAFRRALSELALPAALYITQNDGTVMDAGFCERYPVLTFASGPTNSMRGAAFLSGCRDAVVIDVGGTTTDVGVLVNGFPRTSAVAAEIGGVQTNFRMPDILSFGLGGGSVVDLERRSIGPRSVGYQITSEALIFGGLTCTATDLAVAGGRARLGELDRVQQLDAALVDDLLADIDGHIALAAERMKVVNRPLPVIAVGGGSLLIDGAPAGAGELIKPPHYEVANAVGAAIAQISGEVDQVYVLGARTRAEVLGAARQLATERAIEAGAAADAIEIVELEDIPLTYLPGNATRVRAKAVGPLC